MKMGRNNMRKQGMTAISFIRASMYNANFKKYPCGIAGNEINFVSRWKQYD